MSTNPPNHPYLQEPKAGSVWRVVAIVVGTSLLGAGLLVGFSISHLFTGKELVVTQREKNVLVTAEFLEEQTDGYIFRTDAENTTKTQYVDERVVVRYTYDPQDPSDRSNVACQLIIAASVDESRQIYLDEMESLRSRIEEVNETSKSERVYDLADLGEKTWHTVASQDGKVVGIYFLCLRGQRVFSFRVDGVYLGNYDRVNDLIQFAVNSVDDYQP